MSEPTRPAPIVDADSAPYWQAAAQQRLVVQWCPVCARHQFYPRLLCRTCLGPVEWLEASGQGSVYAFTVVRRAPAGFESSVPYVVALVDLDEGPRLMANVVGVTVDRVAIGLRGRITFEPLQDGVALPQFAADR
jgi:uncharacterized protein